VEESVNLPLISPFWQKAIAGNKQIAKNKKNIFRISFWI
jgi:hypothetical protein